MPGRDRPPRSPLGIEATVRWAQATGASPSVLWCHVTLEERPGLPLTSCVTLGQLLTLSEYQCLIHKTGLGMPTEIVSERPV